MLHQPAPPFEEVAAAVGGLGAVAVDVGEGDVANVAWASEHPAVQSRKLKRNPWGTAATPCSRRSLDMVASLSIRPVGEGIRGRDRRAVRRSGRERQCSGGSGTRCSLFAFMRAPGTAQVAADRSRR